MKAWVYIQAFSVNEANFLYSRQKKNLSVCSYTFLLPPCTPTCLTFSVYELNVLHHLFCSNCVCLMHKTRHRTARFSPPFALSHEPPKLCSHGCCHFTRIFRCLYSLIQYIALTVPVQYLVCILYAHKYVYSLMYVCIVCLYIYVYVCVFVHSLSLAMCGYSYTFYMPIMKRYECRHPLLIIYFYPHFVLLNNENKNVMYFK